MPEEHGLPYVDEHAATIAAPRGAVWDAVTRYARSTLAAAGGGVPGRLLGTDPPGGFEIVEEVPESRLGLAGRHRFSRYRLVFDLADAPGGTTSLTARTYAVFPGPHGTAYRALVIGTRFHVLAVRRMLGAIGRLSAADTDSARR